MKLSSTRIAGLLVSSLFATNAHAADIQSLAWLTGCWAQEGAEPGTVEMWMKPAGGAMLGMSRTVRKGVTATHEFMQIRSEAQALVFIAQPSNQPTATFTAVRVVDREIVFENPAHDFPQRVIYRLKAPGVLAARIEGMRDGKLRGIDFAMKKVACD